MCWRRSLGLPVSLLLSLSALGLVGAEGEPAPGLSFLNSANQSAWSFSGVPAIYLPQIVTLPWNLRRVNTMRQQGGAGDGEGEAEVPEEGDEQDEEKDAAEAQGGGRVVGDLGEARRHRDALGVEGIVEVFEAEEEDGDEGREGRVEDAERSDPEEEQHRLDGAEEEELEGLVDEGASESSERTASPGQNLSLLAKNPLSE